MPTISDLPLKGVLKKRGQNIAFLQFKDREQLSVFQELFSAEVLPQNPKYKLRDSTKKMNPREFKPVKSEEEQREDEERRKESRQATPEEIEQEMKVPLADRVTPYHHLSYAEQIIKKRE